MFLFEWLKVGYDEIDLDWFLLVVVGSFLFVVLEMEWFVDLV